MENEIINFPKELEKLTPQKMRIVNMYLTGMYSNKEIQEQLSIDKKKFYRIMAEPEVKAMIAFFQEREAEMIDYRLKALKFEAVGTMQDLMKSNSEEIQFKAAKDILDRTGHKASQRLEVNKTVTNIERQLKEINNLDFNDGEVVDVDIDGYMAELGFLGDDDD